MSNIFKKYQEFVKKPNRNTFDMSFVNNFTTDFGRLTPVFCKEVLSGDSVNINPTFGLNFVPMAYPVQTKMKAHLHFFYVRTRTLWKDWMDFIGNTKDGLVPPYIDFEANKHLLKTCSLADYLGLPTTIVMPTGSTAKDLGTYHDTLSPDYSTTVLNGESQFWTDGFSTTDLFLTSPDRDQIEENYQLFSITWQQYFEQSRPLNFQIESPFEFYGSSNYDSRSKKIRLYGIVPMTRTTTADNETRFIYDPDSIPALEFNEPIVLRPSAVPMGDEEYHLTYRLSVNDTIKDYLDKITFTPDGSIVSNLTLAFIVKVDTDFSLYDMGAKIYYTYGVDEFKEASDLTNRPYKANTLPISALPFRAYEAIYNSFYRNPQNNPFIKDGQAEYNQYVTNLDGGKDSTIYDLYNRNWEDDPFTTAVQSPQQGIAPLVGVSATGEFTFQDENGTYKAQAQFAEDGESISAINIIDNRMPAGTTRALIDLVSTGISINDFRNVNALQRWLEKNMRRGLRYKDQMMSHFGSDIRYDELLMPEFIGGVSQEVDVNRIINTTASDQAPLGKYAGLAQAFGGTNNHITHYADEHGFIIGILSIVPYANYSQLLPKMFTRNSVLDYYFPEFGHIGMQAITNRDMMPLQCYATGTSDETIQASLNETFGYQRPWWDYISTTDEVHGNFRNYYRDYLLNRVFRTNPVLSPDFLTVNSDDLNDVFVVEDADKQKDKILGIVHFDFKKKTTIPEFGIPKLEVD